jgi:hypothetical protein
MLLEIVKVGLTGWVMDKLGQFCITKELKKGLNQQALTLTKERAK